MALSWWTASRRDRIATMSDERQELLDTQLYGELRRLAQHYLSHEQRRITLQATSLVNEAYVRLSAQRSEAQSRAHFMALAATMMRRVLLDAARARTAERRGGAQQRITLTDVLGIASAPDAEADVLAVDEALRKLEALDPEQAKVVELRYFGGCSVEETAEALGISTPTVKRYWASAKAFLVRELKRTAG